MTLPEAIARLYERSDLGEEGMAAVCELLLAGQAAPAQVGGFLTALHMKGESVGEVAAAARVLRAHMHPVAGVPSGAIDTCGTGGDGAGTFNVSTAAALVVAGAGVPVAKHGNRAASSRVGSADVLEAMGVSLALRPDAVADCVAHTGFTFMFAPNHHPALRAVSGVRRELGVRTVFNLLGPLINPAGVARQVVGVADPAVVDLLAGALAKLGTIRAWVVHGAGQLDELSLAGESRVVEVTPEGRRSFVVSPEALGLEEAPVSALRVDSLAEAAARLGGVLAGEPGPMREATCLNAAAGLVVGGAVPDLADGVARARAAIDSGAAARVLAQVVAFTTAHAGAMA